MRSSSSAALAALLVAGLAAGGTLATGQRSPAGPSPSIAPLRPSRDATSPAEPIDAAARVGLVPSDDPAVTAALREGLSRAFDESRATGGPDLALVVASASTQWSSVASEAVRLACDERVVAIVAPPERTLAHPVAQAATRCGVLVVSTSAAASVTAAGSRWVISVAPRGGQISPRDAGLDAGRLVAQAVRRAGLRRAAVLDAALDGTPVTGADRAVRLGPDGRRESAAK